jgi:hypothetical protein
MWDYYTHSQGVEAVLKWNINHIDGNKPLLLGNVVSKGKASQRESRHMGQTPQSQLTPDVSRRPRENLHQVTQSLPPFANGLVGEGINEPTNSQHCNKCGIIMHTHKGER